MSSVSSSSLSQARPVGGGSVTQSQGQDSDPPDQGLAKEFKLITLSLTPTHSVMAVISRRIHGITATSVPCELD